MPSVPSTVATDSLVLCSDGTKEDSSSLVSSKAGFSRRVGLPPACDWSSTFCEWFRSGSAGVAGSDSIAEEEDEYEANDDWGIVSSSKSWDSVSEGVSGGIVSGSGVSANGEDLRGVDDCALSSCSGSGTGDGDGRGLFDRASEGDGLGVRWPGARSARLVRTGRLSVP